MHDQDAAGAHEGYAIKGQMNLPRIQNRAQSNLSAHNAGSRNKLDDSKRYPDLSEQEQQLIKLAANGLTDIAIANRLGITESTVKSYWLRVRNKLGPHNRTELVAHALREESEQTISELNGEIQRLKQALVRHDKNAVNFYRDVLENTSDAVFAVDRGGCFVWLNLEAERMFGYRLDELVGKPVSLLVPPRLHNRHLSHIIQYLANPERKEMGQHLATLAVRKGGEEFSMSASLGSIETSDGRIVTCFVRDTSESKALDSYLERRGVLP